MKKKVILMGLLLSALFTTTSCTHDEIAEVAKPEVEQTDSQEFITVSLNPGFELTNATEALTRGVSTNDVYGIEVTYSSNGVPQGHYAYGLFDNKDDMTISLLSGYTYNYEFTMIKDGKNKLYNSSSYFYYPFQKSNEIKTMLQNQFITEGSAGLIGLGNGNMHMKSLTRTPTASNAVNLQPIERYYGVTQNYSPVRNGVVTIDLMKQYFGVKVIVEGIDNTISTGTVTTSLGNFWSQSKTDNFTTEDMIYTLPEINTNYTTTLTFNWDDSRGDYWDFSKSMGVTFKRNTLTTIRVSVTQDPTSDKYVLNIEEWDEDNIIDMGINTDGLIDVTVDPQQ